MDRYRVINAWQSSYPDPIVLQKDDIVHIDFSKKEDNPEWQGWVWCIAAEKAGWVPQQILLIEANDKGTSVSAKISEDYSAKELSAGMGSIIFGDKIIHGWLWATDISSNECGWIPLAYLEKIGE